MPATDLISTAQHASSAKIFVHDGITSALKTSFAAIGTSSRGLGWDGTNLLEGRSIRIYVHVGLTTTISSSFPTTPINYPVYGVTWVGDIDAASQTYHTVAMNRVVRYEGKTSVVKTNNPIYDKVQNNRDITWAAGDLVTSERQTPKIYVWSGFTTTLDDSFAAPTDISGLTWDSVGLNLISSSDGTNKKIYIHSGKSSTISSSFDYPQSPSYYPRGLTMGEYGVPTVSQDFSYSYDLGIRDYRDLTVSYDIGALVSKDFAYSYGVSIASTDFEYSYDILIGADFTYRYEIFDWGCLLIHDKDSQKVNIHDGISPTILASFPVHGDPKYIYYALAWDGDTFQGNLISTARRGVDPKSIIAHHLGTSTIIQKSFNSPWNYPSGVAYDGDNFISCDANTGKAFVHEGISNVILDNFRIGRNPFGVEISEEGNLISYEGFSGWHYIQIHDGISSTISEYFRVGIYPPLYPLIRDICIARGDLIAVENHQRKLYQFAGISTIIKNSFITPETYTQGITYGAYFPAVGTDFTYRYGIKNICSDFEYSYDLGAKGATFTASYDINPAADLTVSYDIGAVAANFTYGYSILGYWDGLQTLNDLQIYIVHLEQIRVDLLMFIVKALEEQTNLQIVIAQAFQTDFDVEVYVTYGVPAHRIQLYIPPTIYNLDHDELQVGGITHHLAKEFGVVRLGNLQVDLRNFGKHTYSEDDAASFLKDKDYVWQWIRVRTGWGKNLDQDVETQFQGKLYDLTTFDNYTCTLIGYDPIKDLMEYEIDFKPPNDVTFDEAYVAATSLESLTPMHIIKYLIEDMYWNNGVPGLKWFNFDTGAYENIIDSDSFNSSLDATIHTVISPTTFDSPINLLTMIQDLLKIIGTYMFIARDGKIKFYTPSPERNWSNVNSYSGDPAETGYRELYVSRTKRSYDSIFNSISWKVGASGTSLGAFEDPSSIENFGKRSLEITTRWEISEFAIESLSQRLLARFARPIQKLFGRLSYIERGKALSEEIGNVVQVIDAAHSLSGKFYELTKVTRMLSEENIQFESQDAGAMQGKFAIACSEEDEGDGWGITADQFNLWVERFGFAAYAYGDDPFHQTGQPVGFDPDGNNNGQIDPDYGTQDKWGNGIEEIFIAW